MLFNEPMSHTTEQNTGNAVYADLISSCRHSRLQAAMAAHQPRAPRVLEVMETPAVATGSESTTGGATRAYFTVACLSVVSMLSVVVGGAISA